MINLLPPTAKKAIRREYWLRVVSVALFLLAIVMTLVAALQVPGYVLLHGQLRGYSTQYQAAQSEEQSLKQAEEEVKQVNTLAKHLSNGTDETDLSTYATALERLGGSEVALRQFTASRNASTTAIIVRGVAATRTALASFSSAVTDDPLFEEANVPISNLASDRDIDFQLTVTPSTE